MVIYVHRHFFICIIYFLYNINVYISIFIGRTALQLKLKFQYFGHLIQTTNSLEKTLMFGKIAGRRRRGHQKMRWLDGIMDSVDINLGELQKMVRDRAAWSDAVHRDVKSWTQLED